MVLVILANNHWGLKSVPVNGDEDVSDYREGYFWYLLYYMYVEMPQNPFTYLHRSLQGLLNCPNSSINSTVSWTVSYVSSAQ